MKKIYTTLSHMPLEIKNGTSNIVLVGPIQLTKIFALECMSVNIALYNRIIYFMDDNYDGQVVLNKKVTNLAKDVNSSVQYFIISSSDNGMFVMNKRLLSLGINSHNIYIQLSDNYITKTLIEQYDLATFNIIECGAYGGTGQIFNIEKTLKNKMKIYAFEADKKEVDNLKSKEDSKYFLFNKIVDHSINNNRNLYRISSNGAWAFHKPNIEITHNYASIHSSEKNKVFECVTTKETTTIDYMVSQINDQIDYLYINIDSAEYYALQGAINSLQNKNISVVEVEVYLNEYYEGQPLFGEVDKLMKESGYELLNFRNPNILVPINAPFEIGKEKLIHYNAIYTHNKIDKINFVNSFKHVSILELLGFPLKAFDLIGSIYATCDQSNLSEEKDKLKKITSNIFNAYSTVYNTKIDFDIFLENSVKRFN